MALQKVAIVSGIRTPFVKAGLDFSPLSAVDLGVVALVEALAEAQIPSSEINHVIIGNIGQPADAANVARVISLFSGIPKRVPAVTVQRNCASGMEAITQAAQLIETGRAEVVVAGGTESMTQIPFLFSEKLKETFTQLAFSKTLGKKLQALKKFRLSQLKPVIALETGLTDPVSGMNMGQTAERLAMDFGITREEQDAFALRSHQRAVAAREKLAGEIVPTFVGPQFKKVVSADIGPRDNQTLEALQKLKPYFEKKYGAVTVGNSCPITDGAAMLVLMNADRARAEGREILGYLRGFGYAGCDPSRMGLGPVYASPLALRESGVRLQDMDLIEINEAFAAQVLACVKAFGSKDFVSKNLGGAEEISPLDPEKLNVNGGAIALGHPVGTSGARLVLTVLKELQRRNQKWGLATLCIGGGQGGACVLERPN